MLVTFSPSRVITVPTPSVAKRLHSVSASPSSSPGMKRLTARLEKAKRGRLRASQRLSEALSNSERINSIVLHEGHLTCTKPSRRVRLSLSLGRVRDHVDHRNDHLRR